MTRRGAATVALQMMACVLCLPQLAFACPVCFGAGDGPMASGSNMGIAALLAVTVVMLAAFAAFFLQLRRRANVAAEVPAPVRHSESTRPEIARC